MGEEYVPKKMVMLLDGVWHEIGEGVLIEAEAEPFEETFHVWGGETSYTFTCEFKYCGPIFEVFFARKRKMAALKASYKRKRRSARR